MRSHFNPLQPRGWHGRWIMAGMRAKTAGKRVQSRTGKIYRGARTKGFFPIASVQRTGVSFSGAGIGVGYGHKLTPSFRGSIQVMAKIDRTRQSKHNKFVMGKVNKHLTGIKNPHVRNVLSMLTLGGEHDLDGQTGIVGSGYKPQTHTIKLVNGQQYAQARRQARYGNRNSRGVGTTPSYGELNPDSKNTASKKTASKGHRSAQKAIAPSVTPSTITGAKGAAKPAAKHRPQRRGQKAIGSGKKSITVAHTTVKTPHGQKRRAARKSGGTFTK